MATKRLRQPDQRHSAHGSARIQHDAQKRQEISGTNRAIRARERAARLGPRRPVYQREEEPEYPQLGDLISALEQLPGHDHALDLPRPGISTDSAPFPRALTIGSHNESARNELPQALRD
jgi:hypothetical protein